MAEWTPDIERLQALDDAEWLSVEKNYCGRLFAYVHRRSADHQASEDVVQETLLGAVRGIADYDPAYTFEQYLFGICRNRTIDFLRRRRPQTLQEGEDDDGFAGLEALAHQEETPSAIIRGRELSDRARELLAEILRDWVDETWEQGEFTRLMVIEGLFYGRWRNRDTWERFGLRDETAVAGIKFRALKRLRQLAAVRESQSELLPALAAAAESDGRLLDLDVRDVWGEKRVSCPARHWIGRLITRNLEQGPASFVRFHIEEMECPWCLANFDDLSRADREAEMETLIERVQESTLLYLRSRTRR